MVSGLSFASRASSRVALVGETLALPLLTVALGIRLHPADPLWMNGPFPWAWLGPTILTLRYGSVPGFAAAGLLLSGWAALSFSGWIDGAFPRIASAGGLILVIVSSIFSSAWSRRVLRAESVRAYLEQRLDYLTHQHYVLRLSHDCLEQDAIGRPMSLHDALLALRDLACRAEPPPSHLPGGDALLRLLAEYCRLEAAALYACAGSRCDPAPVARLGPAGVDFNPFDPLVRRALETGTLAHVAQTLAAGKNPGTYLAAAPLKAFDGRCIGLLVVERMPFIALEEEILQSLNLLLRYYSDGLSILAISATLLDRLPSCPPEFAFELQRLWQVRRESGVGSVVVALEIRSPREAGDLVQQIGRHKRSVDVGWLAGDDNRQLLLTLMPLAGTAAAEGYLLGIESWICDRHGRSLVESGIFPRVLPLGDEPPLALLQRLFDDCHVRVDTCSVRTGT